MFSILPTRRSAASRARKAVNHEADALLHGRLAEENRDGGFVERAVVVGEHPPEHVVATAEKDVRDVAVRLYGKTHDPLKTVVRQKILHLLEFIEHDNGPALPGKKLLRKVQDLRQRLGADRRA